MHSDMIKPTFVPKFGHHGRIYWHRHGWMCGRHHGWYFQTRRETLSMYQLEFGAQIHYAISWFGSSKVYTTKPVWVNNEYGGIKIYMEKLKPFFILVFYIILCVTTDSWIRSISPSCFVAVLSIELQIRNKITLDDHSVIKYKYISLAGTIFRFQTAIISKPEPSHCRIDNFVIFAC